MNRRKSSAFRCFVLTTKNRAIGSIVTLLIVLLPLLGNAQSHEFRIGIQKGANKILIGDGFNETKIGHSTALKIDYVLRSKNSKISIEPSIYTVKYFYISRIEENLSVKNSQRSIGTTLMSGISMQENLTFKIGLFAQAVLSNSVDIVSKNGAATTSFGSSALYESYAPRNFQAGVVAAIEITLGEKKRWGIELGVQQFATSFLKNNYLLNFSNTASGSTIVFTGISKPTVVTIGLNFRITG